MRGNNKACTDADGEPTHATYLLSGGSEPAGVLSFADLFGEHWSPVFSWAKKLRPVKGGRWWLCWVTPLLCVVLVGMRVGVMGDRMLK